jgi:hypothetical protein
MKKLLSLLTLLVVFSLVSGCPKKEKEPEKQAEQLATQGSIMNLIPASAEVVIKVGALATFYQQFAVTDTTIFGQPVPNLQTTKANLGFNPLSLTELQAAGIDPKRPVGFALQDLAIAAQADRPNVNLLVFIPVSDGQKLLTTIQTAIQKNAPEVKVTQSGNLTVIQGKAPEDVFYLGLKDQYLVVAANPQGDAKPAIEAILAGTPAITTVAGYKDTLSALGGEQELVVYADLAKIAAKNIEAIKQRAAAEQKPGTPNMNGMLDSLKEYARAGLTLDLDQPDLRVKSIFTMIPDSRMKKLLEGVQTDAAPVFGMSDAPVLLASWAVNVAEYYQFMLGTLAPTEAEQMKAQLAAAKTATEIDVEQEIINNLGGHFSLGIFDGSTITMSNYNALFALTVKDEAVTKTVWAKAVAKIPAPQQSLVTKQVVGNADCYVVAAGLAQPYVCVQDKKLIVAAGKTLMEKALSNKADAGFVAKLQDATLKQSIQESQSVFYLNIAELMKTIKNFEMFFLGTPQAQQAYPKVQAFTGKIDYILGTTKLQGDAVTGDFLIKTQFTQPFLTEVANFAQSLQPQATTAAAPTPEK